ncbi:hypothetical protein Tco_0731106 [Tanacetum coccineum]
MSERFSNESSGISETPDRARSSGKSQRSLTRGKTSSHLRRSKRLENRSKSKAKTREGKAKSGEEGLSTRKQVRIPIISSEGQAPKEHKSVRRKQRSEGSSRHFLSCGRAGRMANADLVGPRSGIKEMLMLDGLVVKKESEEGAVQGSSKEACGNKQIEEAVASGKLTHLVKDIRQGNKRYRGQGRGNVKVINMVELRGNRKRPYEMEGPRLIEEIAFPTIPQNSLADAPIILEGTIEDKKLENENVDLQGPLHKQGFQMLLELIQQAPSYPKISWAREKLPGLLHMLFLALIITLHCLAIIGCPLVAIRSKCDHTDYQRGNPYVRGFVLLLA